MSSDSNANAKGANGDEGGVDGSGFFNPELFINESYDQKHFAYQQYKVSLYALSAASIDFDLTGQVIWPASQVLSRYLIRNSELLKDKLCLEVGSGAGLAGIVSSVFTKHTVLSDNMDVVMRLINKNINESKVIIVDQNENNNNNDDAAVLNNNEKLSSFRLDWSSKEDLDRIQHTHGKFDVIVGADVVYWPSSVIPLLTTIDTLLKPSKNTSDEDNSYSLDIDEPSFLIAYVSRAGTIDRMLHDKAINEFNFHIENIDTTPYKTPKETSTEVILWRIVRKKKKSKEL